MLPKRKQAPIGLPGLRLSAVDALDSGAKHFADVRRRIHGKGDNGHHYTRSIHGSHNHIVHQHEQLICQVFLSEQLLLVFRKAQLVLYVVGKRPVLLVNQV